MESAVGKIISDDIMLLLFVICVGMFAGKLASSLKLPDVAVFIAVGMLLGPGLKLIHEPSGSLVNQMILTVGSVFILFDGGRSLKLSGLRKVWITLSLLSVPGVLITMAVVGTGIHYLF